MREARTGHPLIPVRLLRFRPLAFGLAGAGCGYLALGDLLLPKTWSDRRRSLVGGLVSMARGIGTTFGISLMALAWHLGSHSYQAGNPGYSGSEQARPAFAVLAVVAATAAAIALASRARARGDQRSGRGRGARQVQTTEGHLAQQPGPDQPGPVDAGADQAGGDQIGPELADIVSRLRRAMRRAARATDPALGLSVAQLELLSCITEHPGIRPGQLARMLRLAPSSVATLLGGLQSAGYVMRTPGADSDGDRRTVSLNLSEAGAQAVSRWHRVNEDIIRAALAELPDRDQATLRDAAPALRDLTASIDAQAD